MLGKAPSSPSPFLVSPGSGSFLPPPSDDLSGRNGLPSPSSLLFSPPALTPESGPLSVQMNSPAPPSESVSAPPTPPVDQSVTPSPVSSPSATYSPIVLQRHKHPVRPTGGKKSPSRLKEGDAPFCGQWLFPPTARRSGSISLPPQQETLTSKEIENLKVVIVDDQINLSGNQSPDVMILMKLLGQYGVKSEHIYLIKFSTEDVEFQPEKNRIHCTSARTILQQIETINPSVVIIDHDMPPISGPIVLSEMKESFKESIAFIGWSANADKKDVVDNFKRQGVQEVCLKKIDLGSLKGVLNRALQHIYDAFVMEERQHNEEETRKYAVSL